MLPHVLALLKPRRGILALGFVLMVINRLAGLVLPASPKYLVDDIIGKHQVNLLWPLVLAVMGATLVQGLTSFSLTQLLSKSSQRMITELRGQVQAHIGRLPVSYYDANKTGVLVSRIMSDVEGVRNLLGTGLIEFAGGIMTAIFALVILLQISASMTAVAAAVLVVFALPAEPRVQDHSADLPRAAENQCRGDRAADRIAGRSARGEGLSRGRARRKSVSGRSAAAAGQRAENSDGNVADEPVGATALMGIVERDHHVSWRAADSCRHDDPGHAFYLHSVPRRC